MRLLFAIFLVSSTLNFSVAQQDYKIYTLEQALILPIDSVKAITLSKKKLTEIPKELFIFTSLEYLDLSKNRLTEIPSSISVLRLKHLDLTKNKISSFPLAICRMPNLRYLSLSENTIKYLPDCFKYLIKLEHLDLFQTQLDDIPEYFQTFTRLTYLDVRGMNFTEKFQDHWRTVLSNTKIEFDSPCNCLEKN